MHKEQKCIKDISVLLPQFKKENKVIVFTNGCFDLLHQGHLHLLNEAKKHGDILVVALNDDASVKRLKGETRPVESLALRMQKIAGLEVVDYVISFTEDTPLQLIEQIQPDVLVKGGDYTADKIIGSHIVQNVIIIPLLDGFSTTNSIENKKGN